jgi:hypothetical protein
MRQKLTENGLCGISSRNITFSPEYAASVEQTDRRPAGAAGEANRRAAQAKPNERQQAQGVADSVITPG